MKVNPEPALFFAAKRRLLYLGLLLTASVLCAAEKQPAAGGLEVRFTTAREGTVLVNIYNGDGTLVRRLITGEHMTKGPQKRAWDGLLDDGTMAPPGDYTWKGIFHEGIGLKLRGWVGGGGDLPWVTAEGKGGWGGDRGVPSAVAADEKKVYLGWSLAEQGKSILACDLDGHVQWSHRRSEGPSGCKALAVDDGLVYVLGGLEGAGANGGAIYRLDARDGTPVPWPNGSVDMKLFSLWPADAKTRPDMANAMSVRHGHIYLSFTNSQFLTVLEAKTGAYLQTVVGAPPGMIDVAPTQTPLSDSPDKLSDADFAVISLGDGVLGRILFAHDPFWVVTSDMAQLEENVTFTALTVIGDHGKFRPRTAFIGFGAPHHQVQARSLLNMEEPEWIAGRPGGRPPLGPWQADGLRAVRGVALAADGKLWVAESDAFPKRFSVWDTTGKQGKLVRELFGPMEKGDTGVAINPLDPDVMFAQGCEWRIDRKTGVAKCLGVVIRESVSSAYYGIGKNGHAYLVLQQRADHPIDVLERMTDGVFKLRSRIFYTDETGAEVRKAQATKTVAWADENDDGKIQPEELVSECPQIDFYAPTQELALHSTRTEVGERRRLITVGSWSACGAPKYDLKAGTPLPEGSHEVSADGRLTLGYYGSDLACRDIKDVKPVRRAPEEKDVTRWVLPERQFEEHVPWLFGRALLPAPIRNAWVVASQQQQWHIVTEDGFDLAQFFEGDAQKVVWPKTATPGADMLHSGAMLRGSATQGRDGKLYVLTGDAAYWNMEVTGLEKVKALAGGKLTVAVGK